MKIQENTETMKMFRLMQYYDFTTNSRWQTAASLQIVIFAVLEL